MISNKDVLTFSVLNHLMLKAQLILMWLLHDSSWPSRNFVSFSRDPGGAINSSEITSCDYL